MTTCSVLFRASFLLALAGTVVRAEPEPPPETIVIVDRAPDEPTRDRGRVLGDAPFLTILHPDDHPATASVADALAATAGVQTRSLGGLGAFQAVSIRGTAPGHTAVLIDGVPLARIAAVTTDLGRFSLESFGEIVLYRGAVPVELGGAGVGGAINMITRLGRGERGERVRASLGMGSFGARHLRAHYGDDHRTFRSATTVGYQGATGDYTYFDDNGTLLNRTDDAYRVRGNNGFDQLDATTRLGATDRALVGGARIAWKRQGLPGSTATPTRTARLSTLDAVVDGQGDQLVGAATARQLGYVMLERQALHDPDGELGLGPSGRASTTLAAGGSTTWSLPVGSHRLAAGVEARGERFADRDAMGSTHTLVGTRAGGAVTAAVDLGLAPQLVVTPAVRLDALRSAPTPMTSGPSALVPIDTRWDTALSPRLTARLMVSDDVALKGSTGRYVRLPTLIEVFGNRGFIVGTPDLRPERGPSSDVGLAWAPARRLGALDRVLVQADVFANRTHDTIAYITSTGFVARPINLDDAQAYGAEVVTSARVARTVSVTASYTRLVTSQLSKDPNYHGKPIPRRPGHLAYGRIDGAHRVLGRAAAAWVDGAFQSESTLDQASLGRVPGRVLLGAGVRVELVARLALVTSVANLADVRTSDLPLDPPPSPTLTSTPTPLADLTGFPLPGRSFYLSLEWMH